jgi:hypothetical protein
VVSTSVGGCCFAGVADCCLSGAADSVSPQAARKAVTAIHATAALARFCVISNEYDRGAAAKRSHVKATRPPWRRSPRTLGKAGVSAKGGALVPRFLALSEQERELERLREADELELRRRRERIRDVAAIKSTAEARIGRALRGHEQMFA